tara:strand:+ start:522 stop:665 length:144 start_codon:yes stop_codon:yes gene_type:complete
MKNNFIVARTQSSLSFSAIAKSYKKGISNQKILEFKKQYGQQQPEER